MVQKSSIQCLSRTSGDLFTLTNVQLARNICQMTIDYFELATMLPFSIEFLKNVNVVFIFRCRSVTSPQIIVRLYCNPRSCTIDWSLLRHVRDQNSVY